MDLWWSLTINGLATGFLIFLLAAGLSLIFGLMGVLNFAHGGVFAWGAYAGIWAYAASGNFAIGVACGALAGAVLGFILEKTMITPVYGNHLQQILITLGVMIVLGELIKTVFGANPQGAQPPRWLAGSFTVGDVVMIKYRLFVIAAGALVLALLYMLIHRTKFGLLVRAGVANREMVEILGYDIRNVFLFVFVLGSALAGLGGVLMGPYVGVFTPAIGMEYQLLAFVVVVIGGMESILGTAAAALLVGLANAYVAYYVPPLTAAVNMLLMISVLALRPEGLFGVNRGEN
ncbi:MAG: High-affinity branched-chain amino acid transport system permease protein LivH [Candidatus Carbobacillus altaicus]|uniref:High-affinity branched-chain amino acid transport system permease protein LivH n=1 Tax=Candidatus Carbonibacillus altaicus TaxID=2163959 RepID=A0A2R6Y1Y6_9BACL|nr:MAG: High-affinity branched-chain amino acid transport system permease protein LivH [Candidatus Carbobacillus altaicus]